ncbi:MAG: Ig-like domain-containing protein [Gemmatimonadales bacterium]
MNWLLAAVLVLQGGRGGQGGQGGQGGPLRKSDLVRLISGAALSSVELTELVRRNCLTFQPTDRDRSDFQRLGADRSLLAAVDECARRNATPKPPPAPVTRPAAVPPQPPPPPPTPIASAQRSGFMSGGGQRGSAGARLPRAVVFEARDSAGRPLPGQIVTFTGINARIEPASAATDATGQARAGVTLGQHVGSATVIAAIGVLEKQVAFNVAAGSAQQLVVFCGDGSVAGRFAIRPDSVIVLRVFAQDAFSNPTQLLGLRAAVADARIFRVLHVAQDSISGTVKLKPDQAGTTSLAVIANGMRQYLTVTVPPRAAPGKTDCP